jgi:hypothetical protein
MSGEGYILRRQMCCSQMANGGGVTIDPGTAGSLWNLAKQAATLYGRKLKL